MATATRRHVAAEVRRAEILDACRHLFAARRYTAVSTADIAAATGVSWGLVAHYFGDKAGLYRAVLESIAESTREPEPVTGTLQRRVEALVEHGLTTVEHSKSSWLAVIAGMEVEHAPGIPEIIERGRERAADLALVTLGEEIVGLPSGPARALARSVVSLIETGAQEWLMRERLSREEAAAFAGASIVALVDAAHQTFDQGAPRGHHFP